MSLIRPPLLECRLCTAYAALQVIAAAVAGKYNLSRDTSKLFMSVQHYEAGVTAAKVEGAVEEQLRDLLFKFLVQDRSRLFSPQFIQLYKFTC